MNTATETTNETTNEITTELFALRHAALFGHYPQAHRTLVALEERATGQRLDVARVTKERDAVPFVGAAEAPFADEADDEEATLVRLWRLAASGRFAAAHRLLVCMCLEAGERPDLRRLTEPLGKGRGEGSNVAVGCSRTLWRLQNGALRRRRNRAVRWLARAAGVEGGASPELFAGSLFARIVTEDGTPGAVRRVGSAFEAVLSERLGSEERARTLGWACGALATTVLGLEIGARTSELQHAIGEALVAGARHAAE